MQLKNRGTEMKIIRNDEEYNKALSRVEEIIDKDPDSNTELSDELEVLTLLINKYEDEYYPIDIPDPIDAIKFRMEQQGLKNTDMIQYIGSKSKVSEVFHRKRKLSLSMIRKLNKGLDISAEILISDTGKTLPEEIEGIDWNLFPLSEMIKREWITFNGTLQNAKENAEELIRDFFDRASYNLQTNSIFFRKSIRADSEIDEYALSIWYAKVLIEQKSTKTERNYDKNLINDAFFDDIKRLSIFEEGPLLAKKLLLKFGIKLIIVPHVKVTHIDGATFYNQNQEPIIALSLRYDRMDYFWFTLFHELSHLVLHFDDERKCFFDDLKSQSDISEIEKEADEFAENKLINKKEWSEFYAVYLTETDIILFAEKSRISPAIVAGRIQKERNDYRLFRKLLGQNKVKNIFAI